MRERAPDDAFAFSIRIASVRAFVRVRPSATAPTRSQRMMPFYSSPSGCNIYHVRICACTHHSTRARSLIRKMINLDWMVAAAGWLLDHACTNNRAAAVVN